MYVFKKEQLEKLFALAYSSGRSAVIQEIRSEGNIDEGMLHIDTGDLHEIQDNEDLEPWDLTNAVENTLSLEELNGVEREFGMRVVVCMEEGVINYVDSNVPEMEFTVVEFDSMGDKVVTVRNPAPPTNVFPYRAADFYKELATKAGIEKELVTEAYLELEKHDF